jgi:hypothetical protein
VDVVVPPHPICILINGEVSLLHRYFTPFALLREHKSIVLLDTYRQSQVHDQLDRRDREMICTSGSEVGVTEEMRSELTKHVEEMMVSGQNIRDI